ncbi:MAG: hypothetical protein B6242_14190 [Anaerolineaceae bacterium 4572_78]|nr:MAG: hypothetical protein B6242_14190 [Anaerolineaceae bacterium 4572_78]
MNTFTIFRELETVMDSSAASKIADIIGRVHEDLQNTVTKKEFRLLVDDTRELKGIVKELAEARISRSSKTYRAEGCRISRSSKTYRAEG